MGGVLISPCNHTNGLSVIRTIAQYIKSDIFNNKKQPIVSSSEKIADGKSGGKRYAIKSYNNPYNRRVAPRATDIPSVRDLKKGRKCEILRTHSRTPIQTDDVCPGLRADTRTLIRCCKRRDVSIYKQGSARCAPLLKLR